MHVLTECPLYSKARSKFKFSPNTPDELVSSLSDQKITDMQATAIAKTVHAILTTNHCYIEYYKGQDLHSCSDNSLKIPTKIPQIVFQIYNNYNCTIK